MHFTSNAGGRRVTGEPPHNSPDRPSTRLDLSEADPVGVAVAASTSS